MASELTEIEVVADRTASSRCDDGFLRLRRLTLRNHYRDGSSSREYPCDVVTRPSADAVAIVLYRIETSGSPHPVVHVVLKEGPRAPIYLRRDKDLVRPDRAEYRSIVELVAGLLEPGDEGTGGLEKRASLESHEEAGYRVPVDRIRAIGDGSFASPGISDEKVYYCVADVTGLEREEACGDGSVMEEGTTAVVLELRDAIRRCRRGEIPDMKTEVGLLRLADAIGYLPQLGRFASSLGSELTAAFDDLGAGE
ncbi:MAG: NUDIX hydrolase [Planctomycetes bacterium]|nr:NUDIX hydrolase [Planctomycetota bacterium]